MIHPPCFEFAGPATLQSTRAPAMAVKIQTSTDRDGLTGRETGGPE